MILDVRARGGRDHVVHTSGHSSGAGGRGAGAVGPGAISTAGCCGGAGEAVTITGQGEGITGRRHIGRRDGFVAGVI